MTSEPSTTGPPRIRPELALQPGKSDPRNLLIVWYLRKSVYGLMALGIIAGTVTQTDLSVNWRSGAELGSELSSPLARDGQLIRLARRQRHENRTLARNEKCSPALHRSRAPIAPTNRSVR